MVPNVEFRVTLCFGPAGALLKRMTNDAGAKKFLAGLRPVLLFTLLTALSAMAQASSSRDAKLSRGDLEGAPKMGLSASTFAPVSGFKLTHAKVVWKLDSAFAIPHDQIDKALLDCCAYLKPAENILGEPKVDRSDARQMFADGYGGPGLNMNWGGGRSPINGKLQVKGMGRTEFVNMRDRDEIHSSGYYSYTEALIEAVWSNIANREAPWGANRVVALIDTGILYTQDGRNYKPAVLLIREDMLRPAHFIDNPNIDEKDDFRRERDSKRVSENQKRLPELLPPSRFGKERTLENGLKEFAARIAEQDAYLYANRIQHGAASPSNADLSGRLLDLSTMSALPGWNKLYAADPLPFGDTALAPTYVLKPFIEGLRIQDSERARLLKEATTVYHQAYDDKLRYEFLRVIGLSKSEAETLRDDVSTRKLVRAIRETIDLVYHVPADTFWVTHDADPVDLPRLLMALSQDPLASEAAQAAKLSELPSAEAHLLSEQMSEVFQKALRVSGEGSAEFRERVGQAARERNKNHPSLYRNTAEWSSRDKLVERYRESGDSSILASFVDTLIASDIGTSRQSEKAAAARMNVAKPLDKTLGRAKQFRSAAPLRCEEVFATHH